MSKMRILIGSALLFTCGCGAMTNTDKGLIGGGLIGAGVGTAVGVALHNPAAGAVIGTALGAGTGAVVGAVADEKKEQAYVKSVQDAQAAQAAQIAAKQMRVEDVVTMVQQHVSDDLIIQQIRSTRSNFNLTAQDVVWLKQNGVSDPVVQEMQTQHYGAVYTQPYTQPVYVAPPPERVYIVEPRPAYVGFGYYGGCRRW